MKVLVYIGITLLTLVLAVAGVAGEIIGNPAFAFFETHLNFVFICLAFAHVGSILLLIQPKNKLVSNVSEVTLLTCSLALVLGGQPLFVLANVILFALAKVIFTPNNAPVQSQEPPVEPRIV